MQLLSFFMVILSLRNETARKEVLFTLLQPLLLNQHYSILRDAVIGKLFFFLHTFTVSGLNTLQQKKSIPQEKGKEKERILYLITPVIGLR